jgi:hypothetical protein
MSTLEEQIDIGVPIDRAWECLHRVETHPRFLDGVREARSEGGHRAHLDVDAGGRARNGEPRHDSRRGPVRSALQCTRAPKGLRSVR